MFLRAGKAKEVRVGAESHHQIVVGDGRHVLQGDDFLFQINAGDRRLVEEHRRMVMQHVAGREADGRAREFVGRHLIEQRLEGVVVILVDQRHLNRFV